MFVNHLGGSFYHQRSQVHVNIESDWSKRLSVSCQQEFTDRVYKLTLMFELMAQNPNGFTSHHEQLMCEV